MAVFWWGLGAQTVKACFCYYEIKLTAGKNFLMRSSSLSFQISAKSKILFISDDEMI